MGAAHTRTCAHTHRVGLDMPMAAAANGPELVTQWSHVCGRKLVLPVDQRGSRESRVAHDPAYRLQVHLGVPGLAGS